MKKIILFLFLSVPFLLNAQLTSDDFDAYTTGSFDSQWDPANWVGWFGGASGTVISDEQANSGANSLKVVDGNDLVALLGTLNAGTYEVSFNQYIPSGSGAYYNFQHAYTNTAGNWAAEIYFGDEVGGVAQIAAAGLLTTFNINHDMWIEHKYIFDFTADLVSFYYNDALVIEWQLSTIPGGGAGLSEINGINFFGACLGAGCTSTGYYDDVLVTFIPPPDFDIALATFERPSQYTQVPLPQVQPFNFAAEIQNNGLMTANNVSVTANVYDPSNALVYSESIGSVATLDPGSSTTFNTPPTGFTPFDLGAYTIEYVANLDETDTIPNNMGSYTYIGSDSIYARDDGMYTDGVGAGAPALLGHVYDIFVEGEVEGINMSFAGGAIGETFQGHIFNITAGVPDTIITSTDIFTIASVGGIGSDIFVELQFPMPITLAPGKYAFVIDQQGSTNLLISTSPSIYTPTSSVASLDGGAIWQTLEDFNIFVTMNIRPVFTKIIINTEEPIFANDIKIAPNPTSGLTNLSLELLGSHDLQIDVFNLQGQPVFSKRDRNASGMVQYELNLSNLANGMYIARIQVDDQIVSRKINLIK